MKTRDRRCHWVGLFTRASACSEGRALSRRSWGRSVWVDLVLLVVVCLAASVGPGAASAMAGTGEEIEALPVLDALNRSEEVFSGGGKWTALAWDNSTSSHNTGRDTTTGWGPYDAWPTINGAYWNPASFSGSSAAAVTMPTSPGNAERYVSLWLDLGSPASTKSGYQLRWTVVSGTTYVVKLAKFASGSETVLASSALVTIPAGATMAISDTGGTITVWQGNGSALTSLLSASDATYSSGYAGIEGEGNISRSTNFRAGVIGQPPNTTLVSGPNGSVVPNVSFAFSSSEAGGSLECSLDGAAYASCGSPKAYENLAEGAHTFKARAVNASGPDATPVERSFTVYKAAKAVNTTVLDELLRSEVPLATPQWTKFGWGGEIGGVWNGGYKGYGSSGSSLAAAYWNPSAFGDTAGTNITSATIGTGSPNAAEYEALWLDAGGPSSSRNGYEARFSGVNGAQTNLTVELSKWVSGGRTVLGTATGVSLPAGSVLSITETPGGTLSVWGGTSTITQIVTAQDSAYTSGYAGLEVQGGAGTIYNFRAGNIDTVAPNTTITSGPTGSVLPSAVSFGFSSSEAGSTFECSLDAAAFAACASPKSYPTISQGAHGFRVRALDGAGNTDATPAERSFSVIKPPTVTTNAATSLGGNTATLNASVNPEGAATTYQFEYGTTTAYGTKVPVTAKEAGSGTSAVAVSEAIAGLTPGTTYHFRITATNVNGTSTGADKTFTTPTAPVITLDSPTGIEAHSLTLHSKVNPKGAATTYQFEYGTTTSYGTKVPVAPKEIGAGTTAVAVSEPVSGLQEGTTYHYRVVASNGVGTTYGQDQIVNTLMLPEATTEAATGVEDDEATLNGEVDPNGSETTYYFQYGKTAAYGSQAPLTGEQAGSGASAVEVEAAPELEPETTYHYRVVAVSPAGLDYGQDLTTTTAVTSSAGGDNNGEFVNLMWSGDWNKEGDPAHLKVVQKTGAKLLRVGFFEGRQGSNWGTYDAIVCNAAKDGITIAPSFYRSGIATGGEALQNWKTFVREGVEKYGFGGTEWNSCSASKPIKYWEIYNEENWGANTGGKTLPHAFGEFFEATAGVINNVPNNVSAEVILGGLLSVAKPKTSAEREQRMTPAEFLEAMNMAHPNLIDAIGVHPYAFQVDGHEPRTPNQADDLVEKIRLNIKEVHEARPSMPLWINEIGFTTELNDGSHLPVTEDMQAELIHKTIGMTERKSGDFRIHNVFYYNDWDDPTQASNWAYHCGLQKADGTFRKAFYAFKTEAHGDAGYPRKTRNKTKGRLPLAFSSSLFGMVDPEDLNSWFHFEYGKTTSYGMTTPWEYAGFEAGEKEFSQIAAGLAPKTTYHYRIVSYNENKEFTYGEDEQFTTKPAIDATIRTLNGEPGWVNVTGHMESAGGSLNGAYVNVNFKKKEGGQYVFNSSESTHATITNGEYSLVNWRIGKGEWQVNVVFEGNGQTPRAETGLEEFTVKNAYHLVALQSGKCLEVSYGSSENGMSVHQEPCGDGHTQQAQAFTLVPSPSNPIQYEIVNRNSGKCLDVWNVGQEDGAPVRQYDCLGFGQLNQVFEGIPVSPSDTSHVKYIAQHSHKCLDVTGGSTADGALLQQWTCTGATNQSFGFESVEADPVPTHAYVTPDETLYGHPGYETLHGSVEAPQSVSGQYVNVNFKKYNPSTGRYDYVDTIEPHPTLNSAGQWSYRYWGVGAGDWEVIVVYPGFGSLAESRSPEGAHRFHVGDGYRFQYRQSGKCVSTSGGGTGNGTAIIQWDCSPNPSPGDGQVYSVVPVAPAGSNYFQIRPDSNTGMCMDVAGGTGATQNGAVVQLWQCLGEGQTNQIWNIVELASPNTGWFSFIAKHSGRCMTVSENSVANGARFLQWDCAWAGSQQWRWLPVG
jgi:Ricin-type beta-trefoil lectin domain-like/Ricin-type beta-trefoil lectin domain